MVSDRRLTFRPQSGTSDSIRRYDELRRMQDWMFNLNSSGDFERDSLKLPHGRMKFKLVFKWMLVIGLVTTAVVGGTGYHYWHQRNDLVEAELLKQFSKLAPQLSLSLASADLDSLEHLQLHRIELRDRETGQPLLRARRVTVRLDSQSLLDYQQVVIRAVEIDEADLLVVRRPDGRWNWQDYEWVPPETSGAALPLVDIRRLTVQLHLKHGPDIPSARLVLTSPSLQAVPASAHRIDVDGSAEVAGIGSMKVGGKFDLATGAWSFGGRVQDLTADRKLLELATKSEPRLRQQLSTLDTAVRRTLPPLRTASADPDSALLIGTDLGRAPRFHGQLDISFDAAKAAGESVPQFGLNVDVRDGHLSIPGVPVQLTDVQAEFRANNEEVRLSVTNAGYAAGRLRGIFAMKNGPNAAAPEGLVQVDRFPVTMQLRPACPPKLQELLDRFEPDLLVSGQARVLRQADGRWGLRDVTAQVSEGKLNHYKFRYPLTNISAELKQRPMAGTNGEVIIDVLNAQGNGHENSWTASGFWRNPGPETESVFNLNVVDFPVDERFRRALEDAPRRVVESLDLTGLATAQLEFHRPPGRDQKTYIKIKGHVSQARMNFSRFPYEIDQLEGDLFFDSKTGYWGFGNLRGRHGETELTANGTFSKALQPEGKPEPGVLDLTVNATRLALDSDLYDALSDSHRRVWTLMEPRGFCDLTTKINWTAEPGQKASVHFPKDSPVRVYDAHIRPRPFPYEMDVQQVVLSFNPNDPEHAGVQYCKIHSFQGSHKGAPIAGSGYAQVDDTGEWCVHFDDLHAERLSPDDDLRSALPDSWYDVLTQLQNQGQVSLQDSYLEFKGIVDSDAQVTAAWDMNMLLHGCTFNAGLEVTQVNGAITAEGKWDGMRLENRGKIHLDTAEVLEMPLAKINGPYEIDGMRLILGDEDVLTSRTPTQVDPRDRLQARAYGGTLFMDATVDFRPGKGYMLFTELKNGQLREFARQNLNSSGQLSGTVAAWLALRGKGDDASDVKGRGQMEINPAALLELPVVLELMKALTSLTPSSRTAFDYAMLTFDVRDEQFQFDRIDLVGDALALRGRGRVGFGGNLWLDFYARQPRVQRGLTINSLVRNLGNMVTTLATQWTRVTVRGTTDDPHAQIDPTAQFDDSLKQFLGAFDGRPGNGPALNVPNVFPFAGQSLGFGSRTARQGRR